MEILNPEGRSITASFNPKDLRGKLHELDFENEARIINDTIFPIIKLNIGSFDKIEFRDASEVILVLKNINSSLLGTVLSRCEMLEIEKELEDINKAIKICVRDD